MKSSFARCPMEVQEMLAKRRATEEAAATAQIAQPAATALKDVAQAQAMLGEQRGQ